MSKIKRLATLFMLLLCLSACGNNNAVTTNADVVEEATSEQPDEISDTVDSPEPVEEEPVETVETDEAVNADEEIVDEGNEIPEPNKEENTDETKLEETVSRTECNETVFTNTTSNIRLQPSSTAEKVETVNKGTELLRTAILDNGWSEIQYNGTTCYISSKLVGTENTVIETAADTNANESAPVDTNTDESAPVSTSTIRDGTTKTFSNGQVFVARGQTPNGLTLWHIQGDNSDWPEYMINAYDATGITNDMSDYDKAVAINNYICRVVDYAEVGADDRALYSACLAYGKATCTGYAHAFDALCTMAGVYSNQVTGLANGAHSWDYVLIGDTKYWVDPTWNDGTGNAYLMSTTLWSDHEFGYEK